MSTKKKWQAMRNVWSSIKARTASLAGAITDIATAKQRPQEKFKVHFNDEFGSQPQNFTGLTKYSASASQVLSETPRYTTGSGPRSLDGSTATLAMTSTPMVTQGSTLTAQEFDASTEVEGVYADEEHACPDDQHQGLHQLLPPGLDEEPVGLEALSQDLDEFSDQEPPLGRLTRPGKIVLGPNV